jgi:hypothetical protein
VLKQKKEEKYPSRCFLSPLIFFHLPLFPRSLIQWLPLKPMGRKKISSRESPACSGFSHGAYLSPPIPDISSPSRTAWSFIRWPSLYHLPALFVFLPPRMRLSLLQLPARRVSSPCRSSTASPQLPLLPSSAAPPCCTSRPAELASDLCLSCCCSPMAADSSMRALPVSPSKALWCLAPCAPCRAPSRLPARRARLRVPISHAAALHCALLAELALLSDSTFLRACLYVRAVLLLRVAMSTPSSP